MGQKEMHAPANNITNKQHTSSASPLSPPRRPVWPLACILFMATWAIPPLSLGIPTAQRGLENVDNEVMLYTTIQQSLRERPNDAVAVFPRYLITPASLNEVRYMSRPDAERIRTIEENRLQALGVPSRLMALRDVPTLIDTTETTRRIRIYGIVRNRIENHIHLNYFILISLALIITTVATMLRRDATNETSDDIEHSPADRLATLVVRTAGLIVTLAAAARVSLSTRPSEWSENVQPWLIAVPMLSLAFAAFAPGIWSTLILIRTLVQTDPEVRTELESESTQNVTDSSHSSVAEAHAYVAALRASGASLESISSAELDLKTMEQTQVSTKESSTRRRNLLAGIVTKRRDLQTLICHSAPEDTLKTARENIESARAELGSLANTTFTPKTITVVRTYLPRGLRNLVNRYRALLTVDTERGSRLRMVVNFLVPGAGFLLTGAHKRGGALLCILTFALALVWKTDSSTYSLESEAVVWGLALGLAAITGVWAWALAATRMSEPLTGVYPVRVVVSITTAALLFWGSGLHRDGRWWVREVNSPYSLRVRVSKFAAYHSVLGDEVLREDPLRDPIQSDRDSLRRGLDELGEVGAASSEEHTTTCDPSMSE